MAEVVLFHHVLGLTDGVQALAEGLREGGHAVHTPDLYEGRLADTIDGGMQIVREIGDDALTRRAEAAIDALPGGLVFAGISFGAGLAQRFAQGRSGARGALLYEGCLPLTGEWGIGRWPSDVAVQVHGMDQDPFFALEGDIDSARELVAAVGPQRGELFVYPGGQHLFLDRSLPSYDATATALAVERSRAFLDRLA